MVPKPGIQNSGNYGVQLVYAVVGLSSCVYIYLLVLIKWHFGNIFPRRLTCAGITYVVGLLISVKTREAWIRMQFYFLQEQFLELTESLKIKLEKCFFFFSFPSVVSNGD